MRLNHPDYTKLVIEEYKKKRANNELSPLLAQSTPANIRRECLNVYQERYHKKDEGMLRAFFGPSEQGRPFLQLIRDFEADRFRPLDNYLKGNTEKTDDKNLELLAWLIDFQHRPYVFDKNVFLNEEELSLIDQATNGGERKSTDPDEDEDFQKKSEEPRDFLRKEMNGESVENKKKTIILSNISKNKTDKNRSKKAIIIFLILIICIAGTYVIWQQQNKNAIIGKESVGCMYWANDHYEKVPCNEKGKGLIWPLDEDKMKSFKRITQEDTITEKSIGVIYYITINSKKEYYTTNGGHPVYVTRNLKVLSPYIFENYLRKKEALGKDSLAIKK